VRPAAYRISRLRGLMGPSCQSLAGSGLASFRFSAVVSDAERPRFRPW